MFATSGDVRLWQTVEIGLVSDKEYTNRSTRRTSSPDAKAAARWGPYAKSVCRQDEPPLTRLPGDTERYVACHFADELDLHGFEAPKSVGLLSRENDAQH